MKTEILYEDNSILVIRKPAGLAVQSAGIGQAEEPVEAAVEAVEAAVLVPEPPQAARPRAAAEMPATFRKSRREIIFFIRILLQKIIFS